MSNNDAKRDYETMRDAYFAIVKLNNNDYPYEAHDAVLAAGNLWRVGDIDGALFEMRTALDILTSELY